MKLTMLDYQLWASGFVVDAGILLILLWRRRWKEFPVFAAWSALAVAETVAYFVIYRLSGVGPLYRKVYWLNQIPDFAVQVCVALEIARAVLRREGRWIGDSRSFLMVIGSAGTIAALLLCFWIAPPTRDVLWAWELRFNLFTSLEMCGLLTLITIGVNRLRLGWEGHALALTEALLFWTAAMTVTTALQAYLATRYFTEIDHFRIYAYIGAKLWIAMDFGYPDPAQEILRQGSHAVCPEHTL